MLSTRFEVWVIVGMNKKSKINKYYIIIGIIYFLAIGLTLVMIFQMPRSYYKKQETTYNTVKEEITQTIRGTGDDQVKVARFEELQKANPIEFVVFNQLSDSFLYQSIPIAKPEELTGLLNKQAVSREEVYEENVDGDLYFIWLVQYNLSPQSIVNQWLIILIALVVFLFSTIVGLVFVISRKLIEPLKKLRENIYKISSYQLEKMSNNTAIGADDALSYELAVFSRDLMEKMEQVEVVYTSLEKELQVQSEVSTYKTELLATLTHDLKTPIHTAQLQLERIEEKGAITDEQSKEALEMAYNKIIKVKEDVGDLLKVAYQDNISQLQQIETFDLVVLLKEVYDLFTIEVKRQELFVNISTDDKVLFYGNRIRMKQLINNAISNICRYATVGGEVEIECYQEANRVILRFYNEAEQLTDDEVENAFSLFFRGDDSTEGTGVGMHAMKQIVLENNGKIFFHNHLNGVELICEFTVE